MDTVRLEEPEGDPTNSSFGPANYPNQPEVVWSGLYQRPDEDNLPDNGYLPFGWKRVLRGEGRDAKWLYTNAMQSDKEMPPAYYERPPTYTASEAQKLPDVYSKTEFSNSKATVQIVEFNRETNVAPFWHRPLTDVHEIHAFLRSPPPEGSWRWVHCSGIHGPTMKAVALGTGWPEYRFGGIFLWNRAGIEWANDMLLAHFVIQGMKLFVWYGGGRYPVFITCTSPYKENSTIMTRITHFVDHGCPGRNVVLRTDPSLIFFGIVRALNHESLFSLSHVTRLMDNAYRKGISSPTYYYELHNKLFTLNLDATSFKNAATNLVRAADTKSDQANNSIPLLSEQTLKLLRNQLTSIEVFMNELDEAGKAAESILNLAFNTFAFRTNNLLEILAVITLAAVPLSIATGVLGINYFDSDHINSYQIIITLSVVGGLVLMALIWYGIHFYQKYGIPERRESRALKQPNFLLSASVPLQRPPFLRTTLEALDGSKEDKPKEKKDKMDSLPLFRSNTRQSTRSPISPTP